MDRFTCSIEWEGYLSVDEQWAFYEEGRELLKLFYKIPSEMLKFFPHGMNYIIWNVSYILDCIIAYCISRPRTRGEKNLTKACKIWGRIICIMLKRILDVFGHNT